MDLAQTVSTGSQVAAWAAIVILGLMAVVLVAANWASDKNKKGPKR